jgi:hypothetical protein
LKPRTLGRIFLGGRGYFSLLWVIVVFLLFFKTYFSFYWFFYMFVRTNTLKFNISFPAPSLLLQTFHPSPVWTLVLPHSSGPTFFFFF